MRSASCRQDRTRRRRRCSVRRRGSPGATGRPPTAMTIRSAVTRLPPTSSVWASRKVARASNDGDAGGVQQPAVDAVEPGDLLSLAAISAAQSCRGGCVSQPKPWLSRALAPYSDAITISFFGTQPTLTQVPPQSRSSATPTRAPCPAAMRAQRTPPEPPPMTNRSKSYADAVRASFTCRCRPGPGISSRDNPRCRISSLRGRGPTSSCRRTAPPRSR